MILKLPYFKYIIKIESCNPSQSVTTQPCMSVFLRTFHPVPPLLSLHNRVYVWVPSVPLSSHGTHTLAGSGFSERERVRDGCKIITQIIFILVLRNWKPKLNTWLIEKCLSLVCTTHLQTETQQASSVTLHLQWAQEQRQRLLCDSVSYTQTHKHHHFYLNLKKSSSRFNYLLSAEPCRKQLLNEQPACLKHVKYI